MMIRAKLIKEFGEDIGNQLGNIALTYMTANSGSILCSKLSTEASFNAQYSKGVEQACTYVATLQNQDHSAIFAQIKAGWVEQITQTVRVVNNSVSKGSKYLKIKY